MGYLDQLAGTAGVPVYFGLIPTAAAVWADKLPQGAPTADELSIIDQLYFSTGAGTIDMASRPGGPQGRGHLLPHRPPLDQPGRLLRL